MYLPRFFMRSENWDPWVVILYQGGVLLPSLIAVIVPFGRGGDFIRPQKLEPPRGYIIWGATYCIALRCIAQCIIWEGV